MERIMAKAVDGPLDGLFFSVAAEQTEFSGFNDMPEGSSYVLDGSTLREFQGEEEGLAALAFDGHNLTKVALFNYATGNSS